jgi:hypothetical protein
VLHKDEKDREQVKRRRGPSDLSSDDGLIEGK